MKRPLQHRRGGSSVLRLSTSPLSPNEHSDCATVTVPAVCHGAAVMETLATQPQWRAKAEQTGRSAFHDPVVPLSGQAGAVRCVELR